MVGIFVLVFGGWGVNRWVVKRKAAKAAASASEELPIKE